MKKPYRSLVAAALLCAAVSAAAQELKFAHFVPPTHPYHPQVFVPFAQELEKETGGKLKVRIYPGGELGANPAEQFNRAVDGVADIAMVIPGYTAAQFPRTMLMEYPGVVKSPDDAARGLWNARELLADEYRRVKLLSMWTITPGAIYTRDKPVRTLSDLRGMKLRVASSVGGDLVKAWGATPVFMSVTEVYNALQTGVVDGVLIDGGAALAFKLIEVSKYVTVGMDSVLTTFFLAMNRDAWNRLPAEHKAALDKVTGLHMGERAYKIWDAVSAKGLQAIGNTPGKELIRLSPEEAAKFNATSRSVTDAAIASLEAKGIPARKIAAAMRGG
jgi:TRAP-type transport system periplasmic protein